MKGEEDQSMEYEITLRLLIATSVGAFIGIERQWNHCIAGLRTNILVAVGACLFVLIGSFTSIDHTSTLIASQIVSGIGFLGAGVIMRDGFTIHGLDTAATIWCSAAVGTLAGAGYLTVSIIGTIFILMVNGLLRPLAKYFPRKGS